MNITAEEIGLAVKTIRERAPVVHSITNYVVMNNTANALLALGASPVMAHAEEELAEMVAIASALVRTIRTLSPPWGRARCGADCCSDLRCCCGAARNWRRKGR